VRPSFAVFSVLLAASGVLLTCNHEGPTRAECATHARCRIVSDANSDGDLADDLRRVRNDLLYPEGGTPPTTGRIYLYPPEVPPAGFRYAWNGEVRFCGSTTMVDATPESEPVCDGTASIPQVYFKGWWHQIPFDANCENLGVDEEPVPGTVYACLHVGDRLADGESEPRTVVRIDQQLVFRYAASLPTLWTATVISAAVWLDGVRDSVFRAQIHGDVPARPDLAQSGWGIYASAIDSAIELRLQPGDGVPPQYGLVVDGPMSGSDLTVLSDFSEATAQPHSVFVVAPGTTYVLPDFYDGCAYSADDPVGSCTDFTAHVQHSEQADAFGMDAVVIMDGDRIALDLDVRHMDTDHAAIKLDASDSIGSVGQVDVTGNLFYGGNPGAEAITVTGTTDAVIDAAIETTGACCVRLTGQASWEAGPNYQCNHDTCL
jgi:hypothetical protein